jgi:NhaP-type Na+/H+ or K+/H+ antiporter
VIFWSGLRGAVSTALALSLPLDFPNRSAMQGITFGVVLFTLLLQATTAEAVVARWGRDRSKSELPGGTAGTALRSVEPGVADPSAAESGTPGAVSSEGG